MKRKCILCEEWISDGDTKWYSDSGVEDEELVICEFCYLNLMPMKINEDR